MLLCSDDASPLILLVQAESDARRQLRQQLETEGYRVIEASNCTVCLATVDRSRLNLVLLDMLLAEGDSLDCCRELNQRLDRAVTPVVVLIQQEDSATIESVFAAGACDYIAKPIQWAVLRQRVRRLIQHAQLYQQVQSFNQELGRQIDSCRREIRDRTSQLHRALEFEATLKRITDKVRDSLDEAQILQTAVRELVWALQVGCCNAALYNHNQGTAEVRYEYTASISGYQNRTIAMDGSPEIYQQIAQGYPFQFCTLTPSPLRGRVAMFACPMLNGQDPIGDLWLIHAADRVLEEPEIRLVEQVANQCTIAIRQARLYQDAQTQVRELEKLNQLKDDFLSTVSHELRTPLSNIRLAIQMLEYAIQEAPTEPPTDTDSPVGHKIASYLRILQQECEREISLVNDLLDLQRFETGHHSLSLATVRLENWLSPLVDSFQEQLKARQQRIQVDLSPDLLPFLSDPGCLKRILSELLTNACKYSPSGETIVLRASSTPDQVQISVTNPAIDIPPQELSRIFDKFYRVPSGDPWKQGGTGLGLALIKRLVHHLSGEISVQSQNGQTCFTVRLPTLLEFD
jgi:signal transduction histidine kinase/DNA-binding response OmpR family regulator